MSFAIASPSQQLSKQSYAPKCCSHARRSRHEINKSIPLPQNSAKSSRPTKSGTWRIRMTQITTSVNVCYQPSFWHTVLSTSKQTACADFSAALAFSIAEEVDPSRCRALLLTHSITASLISAFDSGAHSVLIFSVVGYHYRSYTTGVTQE